MASHFGHEGQSHTGEFFFVLTGVQPINFIYLEQRPLTSGRFEYLRPKMLQEHLGTENTVSPSESNENSWRARHFTNLFSTYEWWPKFPVIVPRPHCLYFRCMKTTQSVIQSIYMWSSLRWDMKMYHASITVSSFKFRSSSGRFPRNRAELLRNLKECSTDCMYDIRKSHSSLLDIERQPYFLMLSNKFSLATVHYHGVSMS